ncbi:MAG: hypothetical protein GX621_05905, partial [Pirellulaceae bacterium]|nr:hypothetical protein [Pirellulaceae bacterium]
RNLAAALPEKTKELHARLEAWRKSVGAQTMTPNPNHAPAKTQWNRRNGRVINIYDMP